MASDIELTGDAAVVPLRAHCDCGRRVRVLWSEPLTVFSRPVLLVCGHHPLRRCGFRQLIPESAVTRLDLGAGDG